MSSWSSKESESKGTLVKSFFGKTGREWLEKSDYSERPKPPIDAQPGSKPTFWQRILPNFTKR